MPTDYCTFISFRDSIQIKGEVRFRIFRHLPKRSAHVYYADDQRLREYLEKKYLNAYMVACLCLDLFEACRMMKGVLKLTTISMLMIVYIPSWI